MSSVGAETTSPNIWALAAASSIVGNLFACVGLNLQKHIHSSLQFYHSDIPFHKIPAWWAGLLLIFLGELGNFFAYGFAPIVMIAPLGIVGVLTNVLCARFLHKESYNRFEGFGIACAVAAAGISLLAVPKSGRGLMGELFTEFTYSPPFFIFMFGVLAIYSIMGLSIGVEKKKDNIFIWVFMSALMGSLSVMFAKGLSYGVYVQLMGGQAFHWPTTWINLFAILITTALQTITVTRGLQSFSSSVFVPSYFLIFNLCSVWASLCLLSEWTTPWRYVALLLLVALAIFGLGLFSYVSRILSALATANKARGPRGEQSFYPLLQTEGSDAVYDDAL